MAWIDADYVVNSIGQIQAYSLGLVTTRSGTYAATGRLTQYEAEARGIVGAVLTFAGYSPPATLTGTEDCAGLLRRVANAVMLRTIYQMIPGIQLPESMASMIGTATGELNAIYDKRLPVPGLTPTALAAIGGVKFDSSSQTVQPFRGLRGSTF